MEEKRLEIERKREVAHQRELKERQQGGISLAKWKENNEKAKRAKGQSLNRGPEAEKVDKIPNIRKKGSRAGEKRPKKDKGKENKTAGKKPLKLIMAPQPVKPVKARKEPLEEAPKGI